MADYFPHMILRLDQAKKILKDLDRCNLIELDELRKFRCQVRDFVKAYKGV